MPTIEINSDLIADEYDSTKKYTVGDCVQYEGNLYQLKVERARGILPTNTHYWKKFSISEWMYQIENELLHN